MREVRFVGLDVHKESIVIAVADQAGGPPQAVATVPHEMRSLLKQLKKLASVGPLRCCYEAGPTGFALQRALQKEGIDCVVIAPSLTPKQAGDRVKTDRRDAEKLARFFRSGDLTEVYIPDETTEAMRDLERAREDAKRAQGTARRQLQQFLLRHGRRYEGKTAWTGQHMEWIRYLKFDHEAHNRVLVDYVAAVENATARLAALTKDIVDLVETWSLRPLVKALQALRGVQLLTAVIRMVGDFDAAEEATQEAFEEAVATWRENGVPEYPRAWLVQTARHKAIDRIRRKRNFQTKLESLAHGLPGVASHEPESPAEIPDDRLRLIFTCSHPALASEARIALTLRTLCGLETDEIARAFLVAPITMAQRLVRAKKKIAEARTPYVVPEKSAMPERLHSVLTVLYLVFTEGYAATRGGSLLRTDLSAEAIRLARVVCGLMAPDPPRDALGLLALLLLQDSRRETRLDAAGDVVTLDEQDRTRWDKNQIAEALPLAEEAMQTPGPFALQAALAAVHARAERPDQTDWTEMVRLYDALVRDNPSPVAALNRAVAVAMAEGPSAGLALIDALADSGALDTYHLLHAARADLLRRIGDKERAAESYRRALELVGNDSEPRFLERRLRALA